MKIIEIIGGIRLPINEEEKDFLDAVKEKKTVDMRELNERGKEIALTLHRKGVLNIEDSKITFNKLEDLENVKW